jgi:hypothetical protein
MLRICYSQHWILCGQLAGPWVQELRSCWSRARTVSAFRTVVDLNDVTFIDDEGEMLLADMQGAGVEFIATGVETKHLLENLKGEGAKMSRHIGSRPRPGEGAFDIAGEGFVPSAGDATEKEKP